MADAADFANDLMQERLDQALAARNTRPLPAAHSFMFCESCDEPIPSARRQAISGCTQCVDCQALTELKGARHAR